MNKLITISPDAVVANIEDNSRQFAANVDDLAVQLINEGRQLEPVGLVPIKKGENKGKFRLVFGFRRAAAISNIAEGKLAGDDSPLNQLQGIVLDGIDATDDKAIFEANLAENAHREALNPMDLARSFTKLIDEFKYTAEEAGARVGRGYSKGRVSQLRALLKLPLDIQQQIARGEISPATGYELSKDASDEGKLRAALKAAKNGTGTGKPTKDSVVETRRAAAEAEQASETGAEQTEAARAPEAGAEAAAPKPPKPVSQARSWRTMKSFLEQWCRVSDKAPKDNRQVFVEALIKFQEGRLTEKAFSTKFEKCIPE